jgi:hypothetical protein
MRLGRTSVSAQGSICQTDGLYPPKGVYPLDFRLMPV